MMLEGWTLYTVGLLLAAGVGAGAPLIVNLLFA
jgi:hypothetical protein